MPKTKPVLFSLGELNVRPGALRVLADDLQHAETYLDRHRRGDWGESGVLASRGNDQAVIDDKTIMSRYVIREGVVIYVTTLWDRRQTFVHLPEEY